MARRTPDGCYDPVVARNSSADSDLETAIQASLAEAALGSDINGDVEAAMAASLGQPTIDEGLQLLRTPSVQKDLDSGMGETRAARGQVLRAELRQVDAMLVGLRHELERSRLLRGPSGERFQCDVDCIVGGCQIDKAMEDGILCPECQLFLCHECFGSLNVAHECSVGGRYDRTVLSPTGQPSEPGSLPCPNFPSDCNVGHIPLVEIQRALLHPKNRGRDGEYEDINSPGLSPHKLHLLARRRAAERSLVAADTRTLDLQSKLIRTMTEVRHSRAVEIIAGVANASDLVVLLAERKSEKDELQKALQMFPPVAQIPPPARRTCAQCGGVFHATIEGQCCSLQKPKHFLCNLCFGSYLMHACSDGGSYEQEIIDDQDQSKVVSAPGQVPCPLFCGHIQLGAHGWTMGTNAPTCNCGDMGTSAIERALLDPRNRSAEFFREMNPGGVIRSLEHTLNGSFEPQMWSRETELLGRGVCPANSWETARHRLAEQTAAAATEQAEQSGRIIGADLEHSEATAVERARQKLVNALDTAGTLRCPRCGVRAHKDDACIHMDSCACGSRWCFLCNKESGDGPGQCPRGQGKGGCDEEAMFLQNCPGWENFAIGDETPGMGAQQEFLRRRMAFAARAVKTEIPEQIWRELRHKHSNLLEDVPTPGRCIDWDSIDNATMPMFGNSGETDGGNAAERVQEYWAAMRAQDAEHERRRHHRIIRAARRTIMPAVVLAFVVTFLLVDSIVVMRVSPPASPLVWLNATVICNVEAEMLRYLEKVKQSEAIQTCIAGASSDEDAEYREQACARAAVCSFCSNSIPDNNSLTLPPDLVPCVYDDPARTLEFDGPSNTIKAQVLHSMLSTLPMLEIGWCFLHWIAALWAWAAARNHPDEQESRRNLQYFISLAPIVCAIFYWPAFVSAEELLSQNVFFGMFAIPALLMIGNLVTGALFMWCTTSYFMHNMQALGICLGGLHVANTCCLGCFYQIIAIIFEISNWDYGGSQDHGDADGFALPEDIVLRNKWLVTTPYRAIVIMAACSLGFAVVDVLVTSAEAGWRTGGGGGLKFLLAGSPVHLLRFYIVGWPVLLSPEELGNDVVSSWFKSIVLIGSIALGMTTATKKLIDRMPRTFAEWVGGVDGIAAVGLAAALCPAFALILFWQSIDSESNAGAPSPELFDNDVPLIYWQAVAMIHCGLLFIVGTWLSAGREQVFLQDRVGIGPADTKYLCIRVGGYLTLLTWPVIAPALLSKDVIDLEGAYDSDPMWWFVVGISSLEVGLLGLVYEYETAGRVIPLQWRGCLLMISVLIATAGSGANDFYRSSLN